MNSKKTYIIIISIILLIVLAGAGLTAVTHYIYNAPSVNEDITLEINKGEGLRAISRKLERNGVVSSQNLFILYVMYQGLQDSLKAGEYEFESGSTMSQVADKIARGDVVVYKITVPEGLTVNQIAELLQEKGFSDKDDFIGLTRDKELQSRLLGDGTASFEGYLFPDTYTYIKGATALELIEMMVKRFNTVYGSLTPERANNNLTDSEIIILASIIEKETGAPEERMLVSAVFHNRLRKGMKLDSDPTVIYGLGEGFEGSLRRSDLERKTDYNTYMIKGLPPGPISNPGKASISAALDPAEVDFLYFVSKGDGSGTHKFSSNYKDHKRAVIEYRRNLRGRTKP